MALDPQILSSLSGTEFVALVKKTSDKELAADFAGEHRKELLDSMFQRFPRQFRADKAGDRSARIDFRITGGPDDSSDTYAVVVEGGECSVEHPTTADPDLSLMMGPPEFLKLITGTGNPAMMAMMGKVKLRGDLALAGALANWFHAAG